MKTVKLKVKEALQTLRSGSTRLLPLPQRKLHIKLEHHKAVIAEIDEDHLKEPISIGRSSDCSWVIPKEDKVASGRHAVIVLKNGAILLRDTDSRNGIYRLGQRTPERRLEIGDRISIGECTLVVDQLEEKEKLGIGKFHRLLFLNGPQAGHFFELDGSLFSIGSLPNCQIAFPNDQLISQRHANIAVKADGSCWVQDLKSKNGSSVNGMPLRESERLLKEGDILSVAHMDMKFLDASVKRTQSHFWLSLGVAAATLCLAFGAYSLYQQLNPSSARILSWARSSASQENFVKAKELVDASLTARGADDNEIVRADLLRNINLWEATIANWQKAKALLAGKRYVQAAQILGSLQDGNIDVWSWNDKSAIQDKQSFSAAKKLLDSHLLASSSLKEEDITLGNLLARKKSLVEAIAQTPPAPPDFLLPLRGNAKETLALLEKSIEDSQAIEDAIAVLARIENPDYPLVIAKLERLASQAQGSAKRKAERLLLPLRQLNSAYNSLRALALSLRAFQFDEIANRTVDLPPSEQCAIHPYIADLRKSIASRETALRSTVQNVEALYKRLSGRAGEQGLPKELAAFQAPAVMAGILSCDTLQGKPILASRTKPQGRYDELLGVETFYNFLSNLPDSFDPESCELAFRPSIISARSLLSDMERFLLFVLAPENKWLIGGKLEAYVAELKRQLAERDRLARSLWNGSSGSGFASPRERIIKRGIALLLAGKDTLPGDAAETLHKEFRAFRIPLSDLKKDYDLASSDPERMIRIREQILASGLPGDSMVRTLWSSKSQH